MYYDDYEESYYDSDYDGANEESYYDDANEEALDIAVDMADRYGIDTSAAYDFITTENAKRMMKARERKYERNTGNKIDEYRQRYDEDTGRFRYELNPNSYEGRRRMKADAAYKANTMVGRSYVTSANIDDANRESGAIDRYRKYAEKSRPGGPTMSQAYAARIARGRSGVADYITKDENSRTARRLDIAKGEYTHTQMPKRTSYSYDKTVYGSNRGR